MLPHQRDTCQKMFDLCLWFRFKDKAQNQLSSVKFPLGLQAEIDHNQLHVLVVFSSFASYAKIDTLDFNELWQAHVLAGYQGCTSITLVSSTELCNGNNHCRSKRTINDNMKVGIITAPPPVLCTSHPIWQDFSTNWSYKSDAYWVTH